MKVSQKFSAQEDEKLIQLVKQHPPLYAVKSRSFKGTETRNNIWKLIATEMRKDEIDCKVRWKSIRDYYQRKRKELWKGTCSDTGHFGVKFAHLTFLDNNTIVERLVKNNIQEEEEEEEEEEDADLIENETSHGNFSENSEQSEIIDQDSQDIQCWEELQEIQGAQTTSQIGISDITKRSRSEEHNLIVQEIKKSSLERTSLLLELMNKHLSPQDSDPATSLFFRSIAETVSKFSPLLKNRAKLEVMRIISELELQNMDISLIESVKTEC